MPFSTEKESKAALEGVTREHGEAAREQGRVVREHRGATREHTDEIGLSARAEQRRLSQRGVTYWPQFGEFVYSNTVTLCNA